MAGTQLVPPVAPMLAKAAKAVPESAGAGYLYEPKWDGFRCLLFVGADPTAEHSVEVAGRSESLTRYFPEIVASATAKLPGPLVLDGELVVAQGAAGGSALSFDHLTQRIHPADSRVTLLAEQTPAVVRRLRPARGR